MRVFFDSSAFVKRYVSETGTEAVLTWCDQATKSTGPQGSDGLLPHEKVTDLHQVPIADLAHRSIHLGIRYLGLGAYGGIFASSIVRPCTEPDRNAPCR